MNSIQQKEAYYKKKIHTRGERDPLPAGLAVPQEPGDSLFPSPNISDKSPKIGQRDLSPGEKTAPDGQSGSDIHIGDPLSSPPQGARLETKRTKWAWLRDDIRAKVGECGQKGIKMTCSGCNTPHYFEFRCDHRLCPTCSRLASLRLFHELKDIAVTLPRDIPGWSLKMITLTKKKTSISADYEIIRDSIKKLWHNLFERKRDGIKSGAAVSFELGGGRNVHVHWLFYGPYVPKSKLKREWFRLTGDSYIVDIKQIKEMGAIYEVVKYISKNLDVDDLSDDVLEFYMAIRGRRRVRTYGCFYNRRKDAAADKPVCVLCGRDLWYVGIVEMNDHVRRQIRGDRILRNKSPGSRAA